MAGVLRVTAAMLAGQSADVELSSAATLGELRAAVAAALDIDGSSELRLALGDRVLAGDAAPLGEVGVEDGSHVTAVLRSRCCLMDVPRHFRLVLNSSRRRLGYTRWSSAFTVEYSFTVNVPESRISGTLMRKNDTDRVEIDGRRGKRSGTKGHWMSGDQPFEMDASAFDLGPLLSDWISRIEEVPEEETHAWMDPGLAKPPHWFAVPHDGCIELRVDAPVTLLGRGDPLILARLLVDAEGRPVRAALCHAGDRRREPKAEGMTRADLMDMARDGNQFLEEFDVEFEELPEPEAPAAPGQAQ